MTGVYRVIFVAWSTAVELPYLWWKPSKSSWIVLNLNIHQRLDYIFLICLPSCFNYNNQFYICYLPHPNVRTVHENLKVSVIVQIVSAFMQTPRSCSVSKSNDLVASLSSQLQNKQRQAEHKRNGVAASRHFCNEYWDITDLKLYILKELEACWAKGGFDFSNFPWVLPVTSRKPSSQSNWDRPVDRKYS